MTSNNREDEYRFAGADMTAFVKDWLSALDGPEAVSAGLREHARTDDVTRDRPFYGSAFMAANIGPRAAAAGASNDELRLHAVLMVYQQAGFPGADAHSWDNPTAHARRAFDHANQLTPAGVARLLRQYLVERAARTDPPEFTEMMNSSMGHDPARIAAHERDMAEILHREVRAANLIDPAGEADFDLQLLQLRTA